MIHTYLGEPISFEVKYKNRTSVGISIDVYGMVEVQVPKGTPEDRIPSILEEKWEWILQKKREMDQRWDGQKGKDYRDAGEESLYLGKAYPVVISHDQNILEDKAVFEGDKLHIYVGTTDKDKIRQALKRFYYQQCKMLVEKSMHTHQEHFKMKPRGYRIVESKTTWGTCDAKQQLTFNWKLAMAPMEVIDYVVVHEMCHMVHLNHDRSFWRLVGKIIPDYETRENWLALSGWKMTI
jgi:predicted metal-dependent hydrolase